MEEIGYKTVYIGLGILLILLGLCAVVFFEKLFSKRGWTDTQIKLCKFAAVVVFIIGLYLLIGNLK